MVQPEGPSFTVHGNEVSWQKWNFRVSFNYREGLVLHNVGCAHSPGTPKPSCIIPLLPVLHWCMCRLLAPVSAICAIMVGSPGHRS